MFWLDERRVACNQKQKKKNNFYTTKIIEYYTKLYKIVDGTRFEIHDKKGRREGDLSAE